VLQNDVAIIERDGQRLRILGFKDHLKLAPTWQKTSAEAKSLLAPTGEGDIIALEHSPDILPIITGDLSISPDLKLILASHTHGGQVWLPILGTPIVPSSYGQKYSYGHIRENDVDMFVTSGIGTSILPIRFMMPPEIVVLTIRSDGN
jgi:predicted MPP superfamily phosphohydrolase